MAGSHLQINEIQLSGGTGRSTDEFIELYNPSSSEIDLEALPLRLHIVNSKRSDYSDDDKTLTFIHKTVPPKKYFLITSKKYAENKDNKGIADATYSTNGNSLVSNGALYISTSAEAKKDILDFIGLGTNTYFDKNILPNPKDKTSAERKDPYKDDWQESCIKEGTPGEKNSTEDDCKSPYLGKIRINEIYTEKLIDFVEIKNVSGEKIKIKDWSVADSRYSPKIITEEKIIGPEELYVFEGDFNMNVSKDTAKVFDEDGRLVDLLNYGRSEKNQSYAFDGTLWQWTTKITKGTENKFDKLLSANIKKDEKIYAGVFADFEAKSDKNAKRFTWDFGDGHRSYLKKTRHKYEKPGTYQASLKMTGKGKNNLLSFEVKVEKFGKSKVRIVGISANPKGIDSKNEWIEISNDTKEKVNIKGWSVATGWKNLYNHLIREDFILKPGKTERLTRDLCAFTLANKQAKIELRYPNGKVADKVGYDHKDGSIKDDETFIKQGKKWQWIETRDAGDKELTDGNSSAMKNDLDPNSVSLQAPYPRGPFILSDEEISTSIGKYSEDPAWTAKKETRIFLLSYNSKIKTPPSLLESQGKVLGAQTERSQQEEVHWARRALDMILKESNFILNVFFLKIRP